MTYTRCVQSLSTGHDEDEGKMRMMCEPVNGKPANERSEQEWKKNNVMFSCPCSSFVVLD